jgi:FG-GAP repeat
MAIACSPMARAIGVGFVLLLCVSVAQANEIHPPQGTGPLRLDTSPTWSLYGFHAYSAATAGDINGDGFSDVILGNPTYSNGETSEGTAVLYLGSALGVTTVPAWQVESNQGFAQLGYSVASAGDVNGDGFHDVIVGANNYENGSVDEGKAFLYLGSPAGLAATPAWTAESNQAGASFGFSVASAGDVNGDGFSDVIVGAPYYDNDQVSEGRAFLYLGSAGGLSPSPQRTVESNQTSSNFANSVATAGDVNGDSYSDVIVGAPHYTNGQTLEGRAFVYLGSATGLVASPSSMHESNQTSALFAVSVATAGDVNSDGYSDVIIGAPHFNGGQDREGRAFLYLGSAGGLGASPSWIAESNQIGADFGISVATAGDVDGDGFSDVIIGANSYDNGNISEGKAVVYYGAWPTLQPEPGWSVESNEDYATLGLPVATSGDVNNDGFSDVIVCSLSNGNVDVYHGSAASLSLTAPLRRSLVPNARFGHSVAAAGDADGNGTSEFIIGAPFDGPSAGIAYLVDANSGPIWTAVAGQAFAQFGNSVAGAGDVNGDGYSDLLVGANLYSNGQISEGRAFLYHGSSSGPPTSPAWTAESNQDFAEFGYAVATAGDVNGDGFSDVVIGAYAYDNGQSDEGRVFVYYGSASGLPSSPSWRAESNQGSSGFGYSVATAGDVNRDGFSDLIVGAYLFDNGQTNEGRVFVYHGSASGLAASPSWTAESNQAISDFGISVATAGDVNGDGFSDVIIGAASYDNGHDGEGRAFVYLGSPSGLGASPSWTAEPNAMNAQFGYSLSTAGDVNADGFSDVVIGAPFLTNGSTEEGGAFLYHGSAGGLAAVPSWTAEGNQASASFGFAVTAGGDLDGDGFSDVVVGAPLLDDIAGDDAGFYLAYYGNWDPSQFLNSVGRHVVQSRVDNTRLIPLLGNSDYQTAFRLNGLGVSPAGRARVWFEWEVKPLGAPFTGQDIVAGEVFDTGPPVVFSAVPITERVSGLVNNTRYCWRARIASSSPFFPHSPWLVQPGNGLRETDLRTTGIATGIAGSPPADTPLLLEPIHPNPIGSAGEIAYSLPEAAQVRLAVYDVQGRVRALLDRGLRPAGRQVVRWEGRGFSGARLEAGVYFVKLELDGRSETRKLVWAP